MSGVSAIALLLVLPFLPEVRKPKAASETEEQVSFKTLFKADAVKRILVIGFIAAFRQGVLMSFLPAHTTSFHIGVVQVGIIIAAGIIFTGILLPCFGSLADKVSSHKELMMIIIGSFIGTIIFIVPLCKGFTALLLVNVVVGIGTAMSMAVILDGAVFIGQRVGMGFWMGITNTIISLATIVAPLISGAVLDYAGINAVFYLSGILSLLFTFIGCYYAWKWSKAHKQG